MPWSAKAQELVRQQYAAVGAAARAALGETVSRARDRGAREASTSAPCSSGTAIGWMLAERFVARVPPLLLAGRVAARPPLAPVPRPGDRRRGAHGQGSRLAHEHARQLCRGRRRPAVRDAVSRRRPRRSRERGGGNAWWEELTEAGGEGMVVKPLAFVATRPRGLVQPAVKCRGREYLRIIYGPEYTLPEHLERLRERGPRPQALAGAARVRAGHRGAGAVRAPRAAAARPRVRLRRAGAGERAGGSAAVAKQVKHDTRPQE